MRRETVVRAALAAALTALAAGCAHQGGLALEVERDRLAERESEFLAALSARDADRVAALFSEGAVLHIANMPPVEGRAAIHRFYGNIFRFLTATSAVPASTRMSGSGDMAYSVGSVANEFRGAEGTTRHTGKYLLVWTRAPDGWSIELYAVSRNEQP